jgi:CRISPR/Cas system-associated exonuclease Cas4 (RecB family)
MQHAQFSTSAQPIRIVESPSAELRLEAARAFVGERSPHRDVLIVAASRGAADDLARAVAAATGATIGLHRFSLTQLAARIAAPVLAADGVAPSTDLGAEAVAARAAFEASRAGALEYFAPVAATPGFPRALARTLAELRMAEVSGDRLAALPLGGRDLAALLERFDEQLAAASATDRARLFDVATRQLERASTRDAIALPLASASLVLLDVAPESATEFAFVRALVGSGDASDRSVPAAVSSPRRVLVTVPFGDVATLDRLRAFGVEPEVLRRGDDADLAALRRYLFAPVQPPQRELRGDLTFFSAPGEGRECVEIARRSLAEARRGVRFDEMGVFLRAPDRYTALLEHACNRAGIPLYFERGTRRPHPAGRAFLAMLACACEHLSARRFAEYLSLAQVPRLDESSREPAFVPPDEEEFGPVADARQQMFAFEDTGDPGGADQEAAAPDSDADAVVAGSLRAPWKWETLIVESAVIGGDPARWHRRLDGLAREYRVQIAEERRDDPESPRAERLARDLRNLGHLRGFALPVVDLLATWPPASTWGEWLDRFEALAPMILRQPERVLRVLQQLRPMAAIGGVPLAEARDVVADRLLSLEVEPPRSRYGRVFVGGPRHARGRAFRVVFVAGLAERLFPQRPHEDPMLLDREMRDPLEAGMVVQEDRSRSERLLLQLAVGAATERLWLSYPRLEIAESRPRVPSFYALDVMRAVTGRIPRHELLQEQAARAGGAGLAWPAPEEPGAAIDDMEHDLAVLKRLMGVEPRESVRGQAHYLLRLNESLRRSVTARWARGRSQWSPWDGITRVTGMTQSMLAGQRLGARPYSLSALQKFSACPYQFLLSAIYRLEPPKEIEPLQKLDPLTRGSIFHEVQAEFFRTLQREGRLPVHAGDVPHALATLDAVIAAVAARYEEDLAPAIDRVWRDEINDLARDLHVWVRRLPQSDGWEPAYFEFAFGLPGDEGRDPSSVPDPVLVDGRFRLRGSVDLVERKRAVTGIGTPAEGVQYRVTDHKTGRNRTTPKTVIGGGAILQPVLYGIAVEGALGVAVHSGRLSYCTSAGGFVDHEIPLDATNRRNGLEALEIIDRAVELGFLPAAPSQRACTWCDFRPVCGPDEYERVTRAKSPDRLGDLAALREKP